MNWMEWTIPRSTLQLGKLWILLGLALMIRLHFCMVNMIIILLVKLSNIFSFQEAIFRVVAAILHLGNIEFAKGTETDSSEPKDEKSRLHLKTAAELFMWDHSSEMYSENAYLHRSERLTNLLFCHFC